MNTKSRIELNNIIKDALGLYQNELRKPMVVVFCLDYSGSMQGNGKQQLVSAMEYVLNEENASKDYVQFREDDIIYILPFSSYVLDKWGPVKGNNTDELLSTIKEYKPTGSTNIYDTVVEWFATRAFNKSAEDAVNNCNSNKQGNTGKCDCRPIKKM